jgi:hypothetical protein
MPHTLISSTFSWDCPFKTPVAVGYERSGFQRVGTQDTRYAAMSALYTQSSLPDSKLVSEEEQGPSSWRGGSIKQIENFENSHDLKGQSENFKNP